MTSSSTSHHITVVITFNPNTSYHFTFLQFVDNCHLGACTTLVHAFVTSTLDYCNSLLAGISNSPSTSTTVCSASREIPSHLRRYSRPSSLASQSHHITFTFKLGPMVYKSHHMVVHHPTMPWSSCRIHMCLLFVHSVQLHMAVLLSHGQKLFPLDIVALLPQAKHWWNSLPAHLKNGSIS